MDCYRMKRLLAARCDEGLTPGAREAVDAHLAGCRSCATLARQYASGRTVLKSLPKRTLPRGLETSLRILASHERVRRLTGQRMPRPLAQWVVRARLWADAMMRPLALPLAGGLLSAVVLFALVVPSVFTSYTVPSGMDVPTMLSTEAVLVGSGPYGIDGDEATVYVRLDSQGRLVDYSTPSDQAWVHDPGMRRSVENTLLFMRFVPGTTFGQPASSSIRVNLRRSHIEVQG
ncbi:MAG: zf-HC2 domain-containing protein [Bryobacterales bacterium]|nr:zf-HC2 domain-containing protein [Bryobacterales bacterium]